MTAVRIIAASILAGFGLLARYRHRPGRADVRHVRPLPSPDRRMAQMRAGAGDREQENRHQPAGAGLSGVAGFKRVVTAGNNASKSGIYLIQLARTSCAITIRSLIYRLQQTPGVTQCRHSSKPFAKSSSAPALPI